MEFRARRRIYRGASAVEIVRALERNSMEYPTPGQGLRQFLRWSLDELEGAVPPRELHLSATLEDEELALSYLYLLEEYGAGELLRASLEPASR